MAYRAAQYHPSKRLEVESILQEWMTTPVCTQITRKIDEELMPIMEELLFLGPEGNQHPLFRQLVNWLSDPLRSADDFIYVIWPFAEHVCDIVEPDSKPGFYYEGYMGQVAAEALAIRCPILEGSWEHAAWIVLKYSEDWDYAENGFGSEFFMNWIIHVIGNPDICPNPYLRIRLLFCIKEFLCDDDKRELVVRSLLSACAVLKIEYEQDCLNLIYKTLESTTENVFLLNLDQELSAKLQDMKTSRLLAILHVNSNRMCMNPNGYIHPIELQGLTTILKTIAGYTKLHYNSFKEGIFGYFSDEHLYSICNTLDLIIFNFVKSSQMPPLDDIAASCIIDVLEFIINASDQGHQYVFDIGFRLCESILLNLCIKEKILNTLSGPSPLDSQIAFQEITRKYKFSEPSHLASSPVCQIIIQKYERRLTDLRSMFSHDFILRFPTIHSLLHCDSLDFQMFIKLS